MTPGNHCYILLILIFSILRVTIGSPTWLTPSEQFHQLLNVPISSGKQPYVSQILSSSSNGMKFDNGLSNSKFQIDFTCDASPEFCRKAETVFQRAVDRISNVVMLKRTVTMNLSMFLPCGSDTFIPSCDQNRFLGFAGPTSFLSLLDEDTNEVISYPQALAKNVLDIDLNSITSNNSGSPPEKPNKYDIFASFNSLGDWWMNDGTEIRADQYDLEYVATHEFLHGLGFGITHWFGDPSTHKLFPYPQLTDSTPQSQKFKNLRPPTVWDKFFVSTIDNTPWTKYYSIFQSAVERFTLGQERKLEDFEVWMDTDAQFSDLSKKLFELAVMNKSTVFEGRRGGRYYVETGLRTFTRASSLGHISFEYFFTSNFLMAFATKVRPTDLVTFTSKIATTMAPTNGIGDGVVEILETLGYTTFNFTPPQKRLKIVGDLHVDLKMPRGNNEDNNNFRERVSSYVPTNAPGDII
ncbi:hypothetical protein BKA69DRAFT_1036817 [Paraphysoderma sedebokerense]|nr:hypothetical protein BKA69DRAFT_1036817 [Paraphysoderma sedebokerense]